MMRPTLTTLDETIEAVIANGYSCIPIKQREKRPAELGWTRFCQKPPSPSTVAYWRQQFPEHGLGIPCYRLVIADIDYPDEETAERCDEIVTKRFGATPLKRVGQYPKRHLVFRAETTIASRGMVGFDLLSAKKQAVAFGIHPRTGEPYVWAGQSPMEVPLADLPCVNQRQVDALLRELGMAMPTKASEIVRRSPAAEVSSGWIDESGQVVDMRDTYLYHLICNAAVHSKDPQQVAKMAFAAFEAGADARRPRTRDDQPWSYKHALEKARSVLRNDSRKPSAGDPPISPAIKRQFAARVYEECALRGLPRSAVQVSDAMLGYVGSAGGCFVPAKRLAADCQIDLRTVQNARAELSQRGLWRVMAADDPTFTLPIYTPHLAILGSNVS